MKRELIGKGKQEYIVERLIEREVSLIREMNGTRPMAKRKRHALCKKIRNVNAERDVRFRKLNSHIKESQRINYKNNGIFETMEINQENTID